MKERTLPTRAAQERYRRGTGGYAEQRRQREPPHFAKASPREGSRRVSHGSPVPHGRGHVREEPDCDQDHAGMRSKMSQRRSNAATSSFGLR